MYKKFICDEFVVYLHIHLTGVHAIKVSITEIVAFTTDIASITMDNLLKVVKTTMSLTKEEFETVVSMEYMLNKE